MSDKMTLLVVKETQHVVGAVTLNAATDPPSADDLAKGGLLVRGFVDRTNGTVGDESFTISSDELEAKSVDLDPAILLQPYEYIVADDAATRPSATVSTVTLTTNDATVQTTANVTKDTKVWIQIDGGNLAEPRVGTGKILTGTDTCTIPLETLDHDDYFVLALVAGCSMLTDTTPA